MSIPGSGSLQEFRLLRYNMGYTYFNLQDYTNALNNFKSFESGAAGVSPDVLADAKNRIADSYYISTNYQMAISYYDRVIDYGKSDADYAMFQKGFSQGLMSNEKGKKLAVDQELT